MLRARVVIRFPSLQPMKKWSDAVIPILPIFCLLVLGRELPLAFFNPASVS